MRLQTGQTDNCWHSSKTCPTQWNLEYGQKLWSKSHIG
uniref:Uncharacterized protein n=1 Tax=Anguilla anguilla TaxID=7936 RepID=A0A0E9SZQ0_ANGAN